MPEDTFSTSKPVVGSLQAGSASVTAGLPAGQISWGLFLFLYFPIACWFGWALPPSIGLDYPSYVQAAHFAFIEGKSPYGLTAFNGIPGTMSSSVPPYLHLPPSLLLLWPLAKLPPAETRVLFVLVSHLCFLGSIWLILARLTPLPRDRRLREITIWLSIIYLLLFNPVLSTFAAGQVNFGVLFMICLAFAALKRNASPWCVSLFLSIAILLEAYMALLCLPLLLCKRFRVVAYTCGILALWAVIATLVLPANIWHTWSMLLKSLRGGRANTQIFAALPWNQSINAFVIRLLQDNPFSRAPLAYSSLMKPVERTLAWLVVGVTVFFSFRSWRHNNYKGNEDNHLSAFLLMIYLVAPLSWDHELVYILPTCILAISLLVSGSVRGKLAVMIVAALMLLAWKLPLDHPKITQGWWTLLISAKLYPAVALWLFFLGRLHRAGSARSVGNSRWLNGVPVRSLNLRRQAEQRKAP